MAYPKRTARKSMTSSSPKRRRAKRTRSLIWVRTPCLRRCAAISTTSPNQEGGEGTDAAEVWMITDPSAILVIGTSLRESVYFFLLKKVYVYLCLLPVSSSLRISWVVDGEAHTQTCPLCRGARKGAGATKTSRTLLD